MRVALVLINSPPFNHQFTSGLIWSFKYLQDSLLSREVIAECVFFQKDDKLKSKNYLDFFQPIKLSDIDKLNDYNLIIFSSAGSVDDRKVGSWWLPILERVQKPFFCFIHNENEAWQFPFRDKFFQHEKCKLVLPIVDEMIEIVCPYVKNYMSFYCYGTMKINNCYDEKKDIIAATCRKTTRKRLLEFARLHQDFQKLGFEARIHGPNANFRYAEELNKFSKVIMITGSWINSDSDRKEVLELLREVKFHYNFVFLKRAKFAKRVELITYEAACCGCVPVLCKESTPDFVTNDSAIILPYENLSLLPEMLFERRNEFKKMNQNFLDMLKQQYPENYIDRLIEKIEYYAE